MSMITARKKRTTLYLSIAGLMVMVAAISAISARDPSGVSLRVGMIMVTVGAALWLPWRQLIPAVLLAWLAPNLGRSLVDDTALLNLNMALELPGLAGVAFFTVMAREALKNLEHENVLIGSGNGDLTGMNGETTIFDQAQLQPMLQAELARSRRFGRSFSLVLVGIDEMRQKYDYRDEALWRVSLDATARLLRETRLNVDRVFHYRNDGFAIILPESGEKDIPGLVKRLRRLARQMKPAEGEPGGPVPVYFGATFFPDCATTVEDMMRRAEVALRIAASTTTRYQLDSAEAPELPPAETLRREKDALDEDVVRVPPPAVSNPVAAAIVDEAYAERTRVAGTVGEASEATPVLAAEQAQSLVAGPTVDGSAVASEPVWASSEVAPVTAMIEQDEVGPALESPVVAVEEPEADTVATAGYGVEFEQAAVQAIDPESELIETLVASVMEPEVVVEPEPAGVLVAAGVSGSSEMPSQALEAPVSAAANVADDFEALLRQMDETLKMIKSVRSSAA